MEMNDGMMKDYVVAQIFLRPALLKDTDRIEAGWNKIGLLTMIFLRVLERTWLQLGLRTVVSTVW